MHDVMRRRILRKLEALPDDQLYQVLDFIEFLEAKYARERAAEPDGLQRFAERLEDRMRIRSLSPRAMSGTMKVIGKASRVWENLAGAGEGLISGIESSLEQRRSGRRAVEPEEGRDGEGAAGREGGYGQPRPMGGGAPRSPGNGSGGREEAAES